jgi:hypothetical protein
MVRYLKRACLTSAAVLAAFTLGVQAQGLSAQQAAHNASDHDLAGDEARGVLDDYAVCLLHGRPFAIRKALALPSGSMEQEMALHDAVVDQCIEGGRMTASLGLLRGSLYKAMARQDRKRLAATLPPEPLDYMALAEPVSSELPAVRQAYLLTFASCALHKAPDAVRTIVMAEAHSKQERLGFSQLEPHLGECLDRGNTAEFPKMELVTLLAEVFYREASQAKPDAAH